MSQQILSQFESYIHQHYAGILSISPVNSTTPFKVQNTLSGKSEFLFISKCTPDLYAPLKGRDIQEHTNIKFTMYTERENLIVKFELLNDIIHESEIPKDGAKAFLSILLHQEFITLAVVDSQTYKLIWLTNNISFRTIRFHYKEIFERFGVL
jgi:hypothetical protein